MSFSMTHSKATQERNTPARHSISRLLSEGHDDVQLDQIDQLVF